MSQEVRRMFDKISRKYDLMNDILSFGTHRLWRKKAVKLSGAKTGDNVLDLACGTGDLSFEFKSAVDSGSVIGLDFSPEMIEIAKRKESQRKKGIEFRVGDAMKIDFPDNKFDICSISFGIRNVDSTEKCLEEMARVLKPGGKAVIVEFGQPKGLFGQFYSFYGKHIMPLIGRLIAKDFGAYDYLPKTAAVYPCRDDFLKIMRSVGKFKNEKYYTLSLGIAFIYIGEVR